MWLVQLRLRQKSICREIVKNFQIHPRRVYHIPNGVNENKSKYSVSDQRILRLDFNIAGSDQIILSVGRLVEQKGFIHLIKSFSVVKSLYPKAKLIIIGKGPIESELKMETDKLALTDSIIFAGKDGIPQGL